MSVRSSRQQRVLKSEWVSHLVDIILPHYNVLVYIIHIINGTVFSEATTSNRFRKYIDIMHQKWVAYLHL